MKKLFSLMFALTSILCLNSCSNDDNLEIIFPLGTSFEELVIKESLRDRKYDFEYLSNDELAKNLKSFYEDRGIVFKEDNLGNQNDWVNLSGIGIGDYAKNGVLYEGILLLFQNNKLIQVFAVVDKEDAVSLNIFYSKLQKFKKPKEKTFKQIYSFSGKQESAECNVQQYKSGKVYFENFKNEDEYHTPYMFTYYTKKLLPLFRY